MHLLSMAKANFFLVKTYLMKNSSGELLACDGQNVAKLTTFLVFHYDFAQFTCLTYYTIFVGHNLRQKK